MNRFVLFLLPLLVSSCFSMSKKEQEQNFISQPTVTVTGGKGFELGNWPDEKWWTRFHSEELSELIEIALEKNPTLQAIEQRVEWAKQEAIIARSQLFPFLYFNADDQYALLSRTGLYRTLNETTPLSSNLVDLGLSFTYEFDFWYKYRNLTRAAYTKVAAEAAEEKEVALIVSSALAQAYFALKTNMKRKELFGELACVRKKFTRLQALLNRKAILSKIPPTYSEESYLQAKKWVADIDQEILVTKHLINILRGAGPDEPLPITDYGYNFHYTVEIPKNLNLELLARRPDLAASLLRTRAIAFEVGAAIADFYPNINLTALLGFQTVQISRLFNIHSSGTTGVTPALSLPLYTSGAIRAGVQKKKALYNQAVFEYNELLLKSTQEVADLLAILQALFQKRHDQKQIVDQTELRFSLVSRNYVKGLDDLLQVYKSEEEMILKKLEDVELSNAQYTAFIKLIKALGGGYSE